MSLELVSRKSGVWQKLMCRLGRHHRDGESVRRVDKKWRSVCTGCGASMIKIDEDWMLRSDFLAAAEPGSTTDYSKL